MDIICKLSNKKNGELIPVKEKVKNKYSNDIVIQLLKIRDEEIMMIEASCAAQKKSLLTHYRPDDIMTKGINREYFLKDIYQYMPKYLEWCIKYWEEFEIDINDFKNLPNPTIPNPKPIPSENRLELYPNVEYYIKGILNYIKEGGITKKIEFNFSNETIEILELKRKGQYTAPEYIKSVSISPEEVDRILYTLEGTFYAIEKYCINYIRFYSDKTVITVTVSSKRPSEEILKWFNKENSNVGIGKYILKNAKIDFTIIEPRTKRKTEYSGEGISEDSFLFYIKSDINHNQLKSIYKLLPPSDRHITQNIPFALKKIRVDNKI